MLGNVNDPQVFPTAASQRDIGVPVVFLALGESVFRSQIRRQLATEEYDSGPLQPLRLVINRPITGASDEQLELLETLHC